MLTNIKAVPITISGRLLKSNQLYQRCFSNSHSKQNDVNKTNQPASVAPENTKTDEETDVVLSERHGAITIISLNRSHCRNAVNQAMAKQISTKIEEFENDKESLVGVLHGIGGSFSAGYDMKEFGANKIKPETLFTADGSVGPTRRLIQKPLIGAVGGFCVANGLALALMCDLRVIEEDATLGFFNRRFGIPLMDGCTHRLPALIGLSRALDLVMTGRPITAKEAFEMGLANRIVAPGTSLGQAVNLAKCIAKFPQASLRHDRNALYASTNEAQTFEQSCQNEIMTIDKVVINEINAGIELFKSGVGHGKGQMYKEKTLADWEQSEYEIELKLKSNQNETNKSK